MNKNFSVDPLFTRVESRINFTNCNTFLSKSKGRKILERGGDAEADYGRTISLRFPPPNRRLSCRHRSSHPGTPLDPRPPRPSRLPPPFDSSILSFFLDSGVSSVKMRPPHLSALKSLERVRRR